MSLTARTRVVVDPAPQAPLPLLVAGAGAGVGAASLSVGVFAVLALAAWMLDPGGPQEWTQMLEAGAAAWLAGLGLGPTLGGVSVTLLPLGFSLVLLAALVGAARWATEASAVARRGEAIAVAVAAAGGFAAVAAIVAALSRSLDVSPVRSALAGAAMAGVVTYVTASRRVPGRAAPVAALDIATGAAASVLVLVLVASLAVGVALIARIDEVTSLLVELDPGPSGLLLLAVLSLGYLPAALTWTIAYLLGPGVQVAAGTMVSPYGETVSTALPGFPLLAVLPSQAPTGAAALPLVGIVAGVVAGALLRRRGYSGWRRGIPAALGASATAGCFLAALAWLCSGSVGTASLVGLGPNPLILGASGAGLLAVGSVATAAWPSRSADG